MLLLTRQEFTQAREDYDFSSAIAAGLLTNEEDGSLFLRGDAASKISTVFLYPEGWMIAKWSDMYVMADAENETGIEGYATLDQAEDALYNDYTAHAPYIND